MTHKQKSVNILLKMTIEDEGHIETVTTKHQGRLIQQDQRDVLLFDEELEDGLHISNFFVLQKDYVSIKRSGQISMHQRFSVGKIDETMYEHPHGSIHLETTTHRLTYKTFDHRIGARLEIDYAVSLNGQQKRQHQLVLTYEEVI